MADVGGVPTNINTVTFSFLELWLFINLYDCCLMDFSHWNKSVTLMVRM